MSSPFQPRLPNAPPRLRNPHPFSRAEVPARQLRAAKPADNAARESAPVRDLLASLGF